MKVLLDTHTFLWWIDDDPRLSDRARELIGGGDEVFFSVVSAWEMVIKAHLGRLSLADPAPRFIPKHVEASGFHVLPVNLAHALGVAGLPPIHADPFDRMLVAQALTEQLTLVSGDPLMARYPIDIEW